MSAPHLIICAKVALAFLSLGALLVSVVGMLLRARQRVRRAHQRHGKSVDEVWPVRRLRR